MQKLILPTVALVAAVASSPVEAQEPANPIGFTLSCTMPAGGQTCNAQVSVPAGKRLVIEAVSARAFIPSGQTIQLYISTSAATIPSGSTASRHFIVLTPAPNGTTYYATHPIRMYAMTGGTVSIHSQRITAPAGSPGTVSHEVWFSGYLLP
jgi:hypothetical protein